MQVREPGTLSLIHQTRSWELLQYLVIPLFRVSHRNASALVFPTTVSSLTIIAYVPYLFWQEADPLVTAILQHALADYRHELLLENGCCIPIHQEHGTLDDNVPPLHSRRLSQLLLQAGCTSDYVELPGGGHWFKGVMTTPSLLRFYDEILGDQPAAKPLSSSFGMAIANPGTMGSKGGIVVDQLKSPGRAGRIKAVYNASSSSWHLWTSNIHRLHFSTAAGHDWMHSDLVIDGHKVELLQDVSLSGQWLINLQKNSWEV